MLYYTYRVLLAQYVVVLAENGIEIPISSQL